MYVFLTKCELITDKHFLTLLIHRAWFIESAFCTFYQTFEKRIFCTTLPYNISYEIFHLLLMHVKAILYFRFKAYIVLFQWITPSTNRLKKFSIVYCLHTIHSILSNALLYQCRVWAHYRYPQTIAYTHRHDGI